MDSADLAVAIRLAREATGADALVVANAVPVRRLDRDAEYVLVQLGTPGESGWVAAVNVAAHEVMTYAANPSGEPTAPPAPSADGLGSIEFVWRPSTVSRSPLYPLLHLTTESGERFVDLAGRSFTDLPDSRG